MKPFDLEAALNGAPVVTRDGRQVMQLTLFSADDGYECLAGMCSGRVNLWFSDGLYNRVHGANADLFMAPVKREGWVNVYAGILVPESRIMSSVFKTEREANEMASEECIACIRIEWEES